MSGNRSAPGGFFKDADFDYEARIVLGAAASGLGDVGLVLATLDRITDGDPQSWFDAWTATAAELAARGDAAFDGPGQQSMLFERGVPFRYDWEAVLTPVIDVLVARPDVDASALTGYGISQGGYWITRAVAFERRLVAAVADPGVVDVSASWIAHLPPELLDLLDSDQKDAFNAAMAQGQAGASAAAARTFAFRAKPYGLTDPFDLFTGVRKYQVRDVAGQITTPLLILDPDDEQFFPGQPRELYDLLPGEKEILKFTQAQGANFHCQPTGRQLTHTQMLDWLADHLPARGLC